MKRTELKKIIKEQIKSILKESKFESFEYVDRDHDPKIVQVGMFEKITSKNQIKIGDRFICPVTTENKRGIIDVHSMKPILLYKSTKLQSDWHISFQYHKDNIGKSGASIAWDLCYLFRDDI